MSENVAGDPNGFAGASEHSHQVALMAAVAHYVKYWKELGEQMQMQSLFPEQVVGHGYADAQAMFDYGESMLRLSRALKWYYAVPNGGDRGEESKSRDRRTAMIRGANMKAEGTKKGISDTCLPVARRGYHGLYIEMKAPGKLSGESKEQKEFGAQLASEGYLYAVFDSWAKAMRAIMWYLDFEHCLAWELPD